ncbi:MAG TPA: hypothetical protein VGB77_07565 [Abditibacteriaceae bacterium]|jgi:thiamine phosphate synthase YjbQ (UPF0047 family)
MNNPRIKHLPSNGGAEQSLRQLQDKKAELKSDINQVLHHLLPEQDRRSTDRRHASEQHQDDRRYDNERRLPPQKRLLALRKELSRVLQNEDNLQKWQERQVRLS